MAESTRTRSGSDRDRSTQAEPGGRAAGDGAAKAPEGPRGPPEDPLRIHGTRAGGRLAVVRYLGATSVAHVYRVVHTLMERPCFLKISEGDPSSEDGVPPVMRREAQVVAKLSCPAVLRLVDAGTAGPFAYMAQEWSDGPNLRAVMNLGREVTMPDLLAHGMRLLESLAALHREGLVLRSFNPERIFAPAQGGKADLKLFDLSRAAWVGEAVAPSGREGKRHGTGVRLRDSRYMAPEEIREAPADPRSDLYSFGVLLCEMITGAYPYETRGSGPSAYVASHLKDEPRPITLGPSDGVPEDLPAIVRRLLAKRPEDRFETADAALRAIEDVVVPDLVRLNTPGERHVLEAWRRRVKVGLDRTIERPAFDDDDAPLGLDE